MNDRKTSILLVDDDPDLLWGLGRCLSRAGFSVVTCGDGEEAISCLESQQVDVVITDLKMPRVNGLGVVDWVSENRRSVSVIVMTAFGNPSVRDACLSRGAVLYLEKPVDPEFLIHILSEQPAP